MVNMVAATHPDMCEQTVSMLHGTGTVAGWFGACEVPIRSLDGRFGMVGRVLRLVRVLRERRPEVIEAYGFKAGLIARAAARFGGRPAVVIGVRGIHFTDGEVHDAKARFAQLVERLLQRSVRAYAANSHGAQRFLVAQGFPPEKFTVILNGVATDVPRANPAADPPRIICVARLIPRKRHAVLLCALARLRESGLDFTCELIGIGRSEAEVRRLTRELGLEDVVEFAGYLSVEQIRLRLAQAHIFVLPSAWEGMPGSVMEAMAAGLPVVATRVNGTDEIVLEDETAYLVEVDDVDALEAKLKLLIVDPSLRARLGAAGLERIQEFSFEQLAVRRTEFYREIAEERRRAS